MGKTVEYFYALQSPFTYLGSQRFEEILTAHDARVDCRPVDLMKVFGETGGTPLPQRPPARLKYRLVELERWSRVRGTPINLQPAFFPADGKPAAQLAIAAKQKGANALKLSHAILKACWAEDKDTADWDTLRAIADDCGMDGAALVAAAHEDAARQQLEANTDEAIERGVFGSPWYVLDGEPFWGQDRLDLLEAALAR